MKSTIRRVLRIAAALSTFAATSTASAQLITSVGSLNSPNNTLTFFGLNNTNVSNGYTAVIGGANNITMSYTGNDGLYFDYCTWGLKGNGTSCRPSVGINQAGILRFTFGNGLIAGVGVSMNYAPSSPVYIRARNAANTVLAQYEMNADAPISSSAFQFRGIQLAGNTIASFELEGTGDASAILENLSYTTSTVPEPSTVALFAVGFVALAGFARRRAR